MKIYAITTANNDTLENTCQIHLARDAAVKQFLKWLKSTHKKLKKQIDTLGFRAMLVKNTGVAGLNGTDNGQVCDSKDFASDDLDNAVKFVQQDADTVGVLFDTTDDNHVQATLHTFDLDDTAVLVALDPLGHGTTKSKSKK